ncbi:MAG TPA: TlpA disulfide reductase family protein [Acidimicrobiia bacterium]|nr:TlpA disulfide reductase family protein [Acidimicrobiia bacterium]
MATTKSKSKPGAVAAARKKQPPWLWIGVAAVVLVLAVAAIASSGGSGGKKKSAAGVEETRPVTVTGTPLVKLPSGGDDPAVGQVIPEVKGQAFDGSPVDIRNDGRPKLILFVAHWCPHCQREVPLLAKYLKSNPLPKGVDLYTVATATAATSPNYPPSAWLEKEGWTAPTMADSEDQKAAEAFGLSAFPYFVAVDGSGKVVARTTGEITTDDFVSLAEKTLGNK